MRTAPMRRSRSAQTTQTTNGSGGCPRCRRAADATLPKPRPGPRWQRATQRHMGCRCQTHVDSRKCERQQQPAPAHAPLQAALQPVAQARAARGVGNNDDCREARPDAAQHRQRDSCHGRFHLQRGSEQPPRPSPGKGNGEEREQRSCGAHLADVHEGHGSLWRVAGCGHPHCHGTAFGRSNSSRCAATNCANSIGGRPVSSATVCVTGGVPVNRGSMCSSSITRIKPGSRPSRRSVR